MTNPMTQCVRQLRGGRGIGSPVRGPALVSAMGFGVRYDLDQERGVIANRNHDLYGESIIGLVLIFSQPKGGVAASWSIADLKDRGMTPLGIVFQKASPIFVQGALFAGVPIIHKLTEDPCSLIRTGDELALYPEEGRIDVYRAPRPD